VKPEATNASIIGALKGFNPFGAVAFVAGASVSFSHGYSNLAPFGA